MTGVDAGEEVSTAPDALRLYFRQARGYGRLTAEREVSLAQAIEAGVLAGALLEEPDQKHPGHSRAELAALVAVGRDAHEELFRSNLHLVIYVAQGYSRRGLDLLDVIQEGNLGLLNAILKFDYARGYKFSTLAVAWIRQAITVAIANKGRGIRLPRYVEAEIARLADCRRHLLLEMDREPSISDLAERLSISEARAQNLMEWSRKPLALETPLSSGDGFLADLLVDTSTIEPETAVELSWMRQRIERSLAALEADERLCLELRHGLADGVIRDDQALARALRVRPAELRRLEEAALEKLREPSGGLAELIVA